MKKVYVVIIVLLYAVSSFAYSDNTEDLLSSLDSIIDNAAMWEGKRLKKIEDFRKKFSSVRLPEDEYWVNKNLFDQYSVFNTDSALKYAERNRYLSEQFGEKTLITEWDINRSFILSVTGLLKEAQNVMDSIDLGDVPEDLKPQYFNQLSYLYSHYGQYLGSNASSPIDYLGYSRSYQDSTFAHAKGDDPLYLWYKAWASEYNEGNNMQELKNDLREYLDSASMDTMADAMMAYALSEIFKKEGDVDNRLKYLAKSAICDIKTANKDIASLEVLGKILFSAGDIDRAYSYINFCRKLAQELPNRIRSLTLARVEKDIRDQYSARDLDQRKRLQLYLWILSALSLFLVFAVLLIFHKNKKLVDSRRSLAHLNDKLASNIEELQNLKEIQEKSNIRLKTMNQELSEVNHKLKEANVIKEEYIGQMFHVCSDYIDKLDSFRKEVLRKIKTGQTESLQRYIASPNMIQVELKEFYNRFDTIFLTIFPDFVKDFNALLRPDESILPAEGELLNTPLRIFALVRLGIGDSVKIASLLHCSTQTVYNNRLRVRNKSYLSKDSFANAVKTLGKFQQE